jgi:hypothetical protein
MLNDAEVKDLSNILQGLTDGAAVVRQGNQ